jgi:hypothetical protein
MLLDPEPHIPDMPEVSRMPDVADIPDVADTPDDADIPDVAAVAGAAVPAPIPPPSKLEVAPNIDDGEVPMVEHVVPLLGIEMVPVGAGLMPGDAISVEPSGMPVWETAEPVPVPSGEVAPMLGVGLAIPLTCAVATLPMTSAGRTAAISVNLIGIFLSKRSQHRADERRSAHAVARRYPGVRLSSLRAAVGLKWLRAVLSRKVAGPPQMHN